MKGMYRIRQNTRSPVPPDSLQGRLPEVFKKLVTLAPGEFLPLEKDEIRVLLHWKVDGDWRRGTRHVQEELAHFDCVFRFDSAEGVYVIRKNRKKPECPAPLPPSAPQPQTATQLIEQIATSDRTGEEIIEACRRWLKSAN
jgi:hypothetical protein